MQSLSIVNDFAKARVAKPPPDEPRINGFSDAFRHIVAIISPIFDCKFGCALVPAYHARLTSLKCVPGSEIDNTGPLKPLANLLPEKYGGWEFFCVTAAFRTTSNLFEDSNKLKLVSLIGISRLVAVL